MHFKEKKKKKTYSKKTGSAHLISSDTTASTPCEKHFAAFRSTALKAYPTPQKTIEAEEH